MRKKNSQNLQQKKVAINSSDTVLTLKSINNGKKK